MSLESSIFQAIELQACVRMSVLPDCAHLEQYHKQKDMVLMSVF